LDSKSTHFQYYSFAQVAKKVDLAIWIFFVDLFIETDWISA